MPRFVSNYIQFLYVILPIYLSKSHCKCSNTPTPAPTMHLRTSTVHLVSYPTPISLINPIPDSIFQQPIHHSSKTFTLQPP